MRCASSARDAEEQYDKYLRHDPQLSDWGVTAKRISPVVKYTNYQLRHTRGARAELGARRRRVRLHRSGVLERPADRARRRVEPRAGARREQRTRKLRQLRGAQPARSSRTGSASCSYFYDGRLFTLFKIGEEMSERWLGRMTDFHFRRHLPRVVTARRPLHAYSMGLLDFMVKYALWDPRSARARRCARTRDEIPRGGRARPLRRDRDRQRARRVSPARRCSRARASSVLIVERHDRPGGYAHAFRRRGYRFDSAVHLVSGCEPVPFEGGGVLHDLLSELGVRERCDFVARRPVLPRRVARA